MDTRPKKNPEPLEPSQQEMDEQERLRDEEEQRLYEEGQKLLNEINILKIEGLLFCFDPKQAAKRSGVVTLAEVRGKPVTIELHPNYGQPSTLAYKILQAVFRKATDEGWPMPETVSFGKRELAELVGRSGYGGTDGKQLYRAVMQLRTAIIHCSWHDKETGQWIVGNLNVFADALFAGNGRGRVSKFTVSLSPRIVKSLNDKHFACFNWTRMQELQPIGMALYKRLFFHFSNLFKEGMKPGHVSFEKDYETICREWLGGLKPIEHKSHILKDQLGRHIEGLKRCGLIRSFDVARKADGEGWKLVFTPGRGFFADYDAYYVRGWQPQLRFVQTADRFKIEEPLRLCAYFHQHQDRNHNTFTESEVAQAEKLLETYSFEELKDCIEYAVLKAKETSFKMQTFGALKVYIGSWKEEKERRAAAQRERQLRLACPYCKGQGVVQLLDFRKLVYAYTCPHDMEKIQALETDLVKRTSPN